MNTIAPAIGVAVLPELVGGMYSGYSTNKATPVGADSLMPKRIAMGHPFLYKS